VGLFWLLVGAGVAAVVVPLVAVTGIGLTGVMVAAVCRVMYICHYGWFIPTAVIGGSEGSGGSVTLRYVLPVWNVRPAFV
jgi:hypothetical protein